MTTKIIDLGLAKTVNEPGAQTAISTPGIFAGTPEFASPEQFAGVGADIRSDLYSLGVTLWEMLTGHTPFRGTSAELMHQHEADHCPAILFEAISKASILTGDVLERIQLIITGLRLNPERIRSNLDLSGGMISSEAIMLDLGKTIGRQLAHDVVYEAAQAAAFQGKSFPELLESDPRVNAHLSRTAIDSLLDPTSHTGFSAGIAREQAEVAKRFAEQIHAHLET